MAEPMVVVGLGNPGPTYAANRHNAGVMVLDVLADRIGDRFGNHKGRADVLTARIADTRVALVKPRSFMNDSGGPIAAVLSFYRASAEQLVIVHDELDLPFGTVRLKRGGGEGGHNGLRSISQSVGSRDYVRVRLGVGRPPGRQDPADYVLSNFSGAERKELPLHLEHAADAVEEYLAVGLTAAQNSFHA